MTKDNLTSRILFIGPDYRFPHGGIAKLLNSYSKMFEPYNFIPTMRAPAKGKENKLMTLYRFFLSLAPSFKYALSPKIKVVHINAASDISFFRKSFYLYFFKLFGKKTILHLHSGKFLDLFYNKPGIVKKILRHADRIVTIAKVWEEELSANGFHNITTIGNPIEIPLNTPQQNGNSDKINILFMGLICDNKGIWDVMDMIIKYQEFFRSKNVIFKIAGRGDTERLKKIIDENNLEDIVEFLGWIDREEKDKILSQSHIYIQPSYKEALGIAILEAMSYHLPVVATQTGGIPEIVIHGQTGLLSNPGNIDCLFQNISKLIKEPELRRKFGEEGYKLAEQYEASNIKKILIDLYNSIISE